MYVVLLCGNGNEILELFISDDSPQGRQTLRVVPFCKLAPTLAELVPPIPRMSVALSSSAAAPLSAEIKRHIACSKHAHHEPMIID